MQQQQEEQQELRVRKVLRRGGKSSHGLMGCCSMVRLGPAAVGKGLEERSITVGGERRLKRMRRRCRQQRGPRGFVILTAILIVMMTTAARVVMATVVTVATVVMAALAAMVATAMAMAVAIVITMAPAAALVALVALVALAAAAIITGQGGLEGVAGLEGQVLQLVLAAARSLGILWLATAQSAALPRRPMRCNVRTATTKPAGGRPSTSGQSVRVFQS